MLDAIAEIDNLGMEDSTLAADASTTSLDTNAALSESQGSSMQETDFNQSMVDMLSTLDTPANALNPSLQIVSGQSLEDALADAIPGLDPTTVTPPAPLAQESTLSSATSADITNPSLQIVSGQSLEDALADAIPGLDPTTVTSPDALVQDSGLNPFMMAALSELDNSEALGEAFQTVSNSFEGLSNSFEQLAASFLTPEKGLDTGTIGTHHNDASADLEVKNLTIADASSDTKVNHSKVAIVNASDDDTDTTTDKVAIADNGNPINADFSVTNTTSTNNNIAPGTGFNPDFDALKVDVDQVGRGLQFLVQQLESAFEGNDSALTTLSASHSSS